MPHIKKFEGFLVDSDQVGEVVTPAYDAMTPAERRGFAESHPGNYVNVMRTLEEFDESGPTLEEILEFNQTNLNTLLNNGAFVRTADPAYYLYRLRSGTHEQTGVVADIPVEDYTSGRLKKHEDTQLEKENMLTHYQQTVGVTSSPICVGYPDRDDINEAVDKAVQSPPYLKFSAWDDVEQTIWRISDPEIASQLEFGFGQIETTYLTDGHHRCASGARIASQPSSAGRGLLVSLFPESQLRIFSYFRCVRDLGELSLSDLIHSIRDAGIEIERISADDGDSLLPDRARCITMIADENAYRLQVPESMVPSNDPVGSLDVSILQDRILSPILGIHDARTDSRLSYTPGVEGVSGLMARCREGWRLGFACVDTTMQEVMDVADARLVMPPKSTWFDPKLRGGIFLRYC